MSDAAVVRTASVESWEDHVEAWHHLGRRIDGAAWDKAALVVSLKGHYGERSIERFAEDVRCGESTLYALALTFEVFPEKSQRLENVSFTHHLRAATLAASPEEARTALALAQEQKWSERALCAHLKPRTPPKPETCAADSGACGPPSTDDKIFHISAMVESFYSLKDYEIEPLVRVGSKRSLKELSRKIRTAREWLAALENAIKERTK